MATSTVTDWDEIEADPDFSSLPQESRVKLFDDWENKFNRSLLEGADLDKVKPEGLNSFAAVNAVRRRKLAGEDVSDPDAAVKTWAEQKQAEAKLGQQALKDYADVEDKAFRVRDADSRITAAGLNETYVGEGRAMLDSSKSAAQKNLEAAEAKFTPEVKAQAQAANEALRGERKVATLYGSIYTDPALVLNKDEFRQQVLDSDASPEAKALKLASYQSEKKRYLDEAVNTLTKGDPQIPLAESFPKFLESKGFNLDQEMMQQSEGKLDYSPIQKQRELAQEYLTKMQDRGWSRKIGSAIATGVATGMLDIGTQAVGTAAMLTGDEEKSKVAAELSRASGDIGAAQGLEGDMQATGGTFAGGVARLGTGMAPMFLPGGAVGGIARLAGAGAGAATAAAVGASALTAGAQTAGSQFGEVYDHLRRQGRTHEQAFDVSRNAAVLSGAVTTGLTALGGATGVESLLRQGGKELVKSRLLSAIKAVPGGAAAEIAEELPDEYISQLVSAFAKDPNASPSQVTDEFAANAPDLMLQIAALGGAGAGVGRFRETTTDPTKAAQEAEFPTAGAPPPLRPQDYENRAAGGQPMFNEDGDVIDVAPPGATPEETAAYREEIRAAAEAATKGATPEVVDPIEGVDPAITDGINARLATGKASDLAGQTLAELERQKAAQEEALKAAQAATSAPAAETLGVTAPPAPAVQTETTEPIETGEPETETTEPPVVEPTEEAETLGVTPPPAPAMEVPEGAARNADMLRQAAARAAGTEQGPRIGFLQSSPITPKGEAPTTATEGQPMPGGSGEVEWAPAVSTPAAFTAKNGQKLVGTVQSIKDGKAVVRFLWNGKEVVETVPVSQLARPVASLTEPPKYQYTQEQNTRKMGKHFPTAPGVYTNYDFRKSFASMAKDTSLSRIYRMIAKVMSKMPAFANMDLHVVADEDVRYAGEYSFSNGRGAIAVNLRQVGRGKVDALGTILHEALHHLTLAKVRNPKDAWENEIIDKLDAIRGKVLEYAESQGLGERLNYELDTVEEFISAVFTRPDFQNFLASIPDSFAPAVAVGKFRSMLSEVFRRLAELATGEMVAKGSTMEQAMTSVLALFETPHRVVETGKLEKLSAVQSKPGYRTPADMLAEAAQKAKGEAVGTKPQGLASMFKPQAKRPATGERKLLDMPVRNTLANAYREAVRGSSTQMAPLSAVYAQARLLQPGLTEEAFLAQVQEGYDNGTLLLEGAGSQQEAAQAGLSLPGTPVGTAVRMMPASQGTPKSMADDGERQLEGANMGRAMEMLGASLYAKNVSGTIGKEVFQNAVDAVMKNENGKARTIWYGQPDADHFVVADTGTGMNPDIIVDKFLRAFVSGKDVGAGGGFGLAKLAFLGSPRKFKIISVGTSTDGRKVKTTLQGTGKSFLYFNENPPRIRFQPDTDITLAPEFTMRFSYEDAQALPTGTAMEFDMDEPWNASSAISAGMEYVEGIQSSGIKKGTTDLGYGNKATGDELLREMGYSSARSDESMAATLSSSKPYTVLHSFSTPSADVDVIVREGAKIKKTRYTYVPVLNRSIFQFSTSFNLNNEVALPEGLVVNIKPKVRAGTADYPFTTNREAVTDSVKREIERFFQEAGARENAKLNAKYANAIDSAAQIPGTGKVLLDTASTLPPALLDDLVNSASVQRALGDVAKIQDAVLKMLGRKFGPKFQRARFAGLITGARAYGVHFGKPGSLEPTAIYHDIWKEMAMAQDEFLQIRNNDPELNGLSTQELDRLSYDTFLTKVAGVAFHEALHQDVNSEGEPLARELTFKAGDIVDAVVSLLNNTHTSDEITDTINDLLNQKYRIDVYEDSQTASEFVTAQGGYDGYAMAERGPATGSGKGSGKTGSQRVGATPFSPADDADQRESDAVFGVMMEDGRFEEGLKQYDKAKRARLGAPPQPSANTSTPPRFTSSAQFAAAFEAAFLRGDFDYFLEALKQADRHIYVPEMKKYINASKLGYADAAERLEWFRHAIAGTVPPNVKPQAKTPPQPQPSAGAPPPPVGMPPPPPAATPPPKAGVSNRPMLTLNTAAMGLIAKKLGASIRINTLLRRARGRIKLSMADGSEIELSKHLFKDPVQAAKTLAHEIGHLFDFLPASGFTRTLAHKLAPLGDFRKVFGNDLADWFMDGGKKIKPSKITQLIKSELVTLSKKWRGDFSPSDKYRGSGKELYADFISAILNDPMWTAKNAPYATLGFLNALEQKSEVDEAYKLVVSLVQGGSLYKALAEADRGKSTTALERLIAKSDALTKSKKIFKDAVRGLYRSMFGSWLPTAVRDGGIWNSYWKRLNNLGTPKDYNWAQEEASQYTVRRIAEFDNDIARDVGIPLKTAGIDPHYLQRLQTNNRIIHERRQVGKLIEEDPVKARQLLKWMVDAGLLGKDVQDEVDATADDGLYKKTAEVIYKLHASGDGFERALKAARRKDAPADAEKALYAFDVSGFMLNPNVFTMESAEADNADIEKTLGPDQFGELQRINDAYHDLIKRTMVDAYKLGLFRKSTWDDVIVPNFGVYVPFMPIKYFTGYVKGGIGPSRVGTANDLMAPHTVGISKMHALISRMQQQKQALLLIDFFNNTGLSDEIEPVEDEKFDRQKAAELTKQSKNTVSYVPYWDEGEYKWVKVNGTDAVSLIRNSDPDDLAAVYQLLKANTRLWQMNFTIFSIAFNVANTLRNVVTPSVDIGPKAGYKAAKQLLSVIPQIGKWVWARMAGRDMTSLVAASISLEHAMHKPGMPVSAELQEFYDRGILQPSPDVASLRMTQEELARSVVGALSSPELLLRGGNKAAKDMNWFDKTLKQYFYSAVDVLSFIGSVSEAAPKVAAYKALKEKKNSKGGPAFTDAQATYLATLEGIPRPGIGGSDSALWGMVLLFFRIMGQSWRKHLIMATAPQTRAGFLMRHMLFQGAKYGLQAMAANGAIDYLIALGAAAAAGGDDDDIEKYKQVDWAEAVSRQSDHKLSRGGVGPLICWVLPDGSIEPPYGHKSIPADWVPIMPRLPGTEFSRELDPMSYYATSKTIAPTIAPVNDDVFWNDYMRGLVSLNPAFEVVSDAMSVLGPTPPRDSYRGREKVEQRIWDEGYVARMLGLGEHHLKSFGIGSNPYDVPLPGAWNVLKKPGFKTLLSSDNMVGVREERRARREDDLTSSFAQNMVGEKFGTLKNTFNRLKGKATPMTRQEEEIYSLLKPVMSKQFYGTQKNDGMYDVLQSYARMKAQGLQDTPGGQLLKAEADQIVKDLEQTAEELQKPLEFIRTHTLP